ncbi:uncharacterized protein LOC126709216 isoform X2 [Quercus robur]|uniref:uncharacterized protein LOC126709216 isoform X2 n=1 Tax=Quercus robur TaxID=38942 RepID=UPI0021625452|nr:uncharacterized protein LOC126709216 isoform X2 [Quercus robur]
MEGSGESGECDPYDMQCAPSSTMGMGTRSWDMKKSFNLALRPLLTACSNQGFCSAFPNLSTEEQQHLHRLFLQVLTSLHESIEDEFESLCLETQVGAALDTVEQLVEEQALDPLFSDKTNVMDVAQNLSSAKRSEIQYLTDMLNMEGDGRCQTLGRCRREVKKQEFKLWDIWQQHG